MSTETKLEVEMSKTPVQTGSIVEQISTSIRSTLEENQQVTELLEMEKTYSGEVAGQLKQIIASLNESFHLKPDSISSTDSSISDVVLTPQGMVLVFKNSGTCVTRPLELMPSESLVKILGEVIPNAVGLMNKKRQRLSTRVLSLEKLSKEMKRLSGGSRPQQATPS